MRSDTLKEELQLDLAGIQTVAFDILLTLQSYCIRHGLHPYLCGGTLLGAVRHGGFIPWDDDVDLFLSRPDYERLKQLVEKEPIREDLVLAYRENGLLLRQFMRVYNTNTIAHHATQHDLSHRHLWVDILPIDGMPADLDELRRRQKWRHILSTMNTIAMWKYGSSRNRRIRYKRYVLWPVARLLGAGFWSSCQIRYAQKYDFETSEYVGCMAAGKYGIGERMLREEFLRPVPMEFEGYPFETMSCWHTYLSGIYGDYMQPPKNTTAHVMYAGIEAEAFERIRNEYSAVYARRCTETRSLVVETDAPTE